MGHTIPTLAERSAVAANAKRHYEKTIRPKLTKHDHGRFVAIDSVTGDYEIDDDDLTALTKLGVRVDPHQIFLTRVGFPTAYRLPSLTIANSPPRDFLPHRRPLA